MIKIKLSKNGTKYKGMYETIVDDCDSDLGDLSWAVKLTKHLKYVKRRVSHNSTVLMHRVVIERILDRTLSKGECVDHIDGNGLNNRRGNLRLATNQQNIRNSRKRTDNTSGYKGVIKSRTKWLAQIVHNKKRIYLGSFDTPEQAYTAYCEAAKELHGEFWNDGSES